MDRRQFLAVAGLGTALGPSTLPGAEPAAGKPSGAGETLYNGIRLPSPWPPKITEIPREPVTPPYLKTPPAVIPIDVGRQLLVDDFLIAETTLRRVFHTPTPHANNPLVRPEDRKSTRL